MDFCYKCLVGARPQRLRHRSLVIRLHVARIPSVMSALQVSMGMRGRSSSSHHHQVAFFLGLLYTTYFRNWYVVSTVGSMYEKSHTKYCNTKPGHAVQETTARRHTSHFIRPSRLLNRQVPTISSNERVDHPVPRVVDMLAPVACKTARTPRSSAPASVEPSGGGVAMQCS